MPANLPHETELLSVTFSLSQFLWNFAPRMGVHRHAKPSEMSCLDDVYKLSEYLVFFRPAPPFEGIFILAGHKVFQMQPTNAVFQEMLSPRLKKHIPEIVECHVASGAHDSINQVALFAAVIEVTANHQTPPVRAASSLRRQIR